MSFVKNLLNIFRKKDIGHSCVSPDVHDDRFGNIENKLAEMKKRAEEFCQSRTNFQLEKFLACDEYTPVMRFRHVAHNSYVTMQEIRKLMIDRERKVRELKSKEDEIAGSGDVHYKNYDLDIYEISRYLEDIEIRIRGLLKEVSYMERICEELERGNGGPFTMEQLESEQPEYWRRRFARQSLRALEGARSGVGEGNVHSMWMAMEKPILPDSKNEMRPLDYYNINDLGTASFKSVPGLEEKFLKKIEGG